MSTAQFQNAGNVGAILARVLNDEGAVRRLSSRSGISAVTLRSIAAKGTISSYVTAVALERATDGAIVADEVTTASTKGAEFYRREPARSLLTKAFEEGVTIARLLGRYELTTGDLWNFMNAPIGKYQRTKEKVGKALADLNLPNAREDS